MSTLLKEPKPKGRRGVIAQLVARLAEHSLGLDLASITDQYSDLREEPLRGRCEHGAPGKLHKSATGEGHYLFGSSDCFFRHMAIHDGHVEGSSKGLPTANTPTDSSISTEEQSLAKHSGLGGLVGPRVPLDQLVTVALFFLFGRFLTKLGKAFDKIREFIFVPGFSQRLNQVVHRRLVLWI